MSKVALYARVSTDDKSQNPETQLMALREYCNNANLKVFKEYVDYARAKDYKKRTNWQQLQKDARQRKFNTVIVLRLDRPFRSVRECANVLGDWIERSIDFKCLQQDIIDTTTSSGRFITHIIAAVSELESEWIGERVSAGMKRAKAEGKSLGRKRLNIAKQNIKEAIDTAGSVSGASRLLNCSRAYIYKALADD